MINRDLTSNYNFWTGTFLRLSSAEKRRVGVSKRTVFEPIDDHVKPMTKFEGCTNIIVQRNVESMLQEPVMLEHESFAQRR